jgi:molybdopterin molybdotransferase
MGHGIAQVMAAAGHNVWLYEPEVSRAEAGKTRIEGNLDRALAKAKITEGERDQILGRVGIAQDLAGAAKSADLVVTIGGASVGEHDLVQKALGPKGFELDFWKIAMRPGKPLIFGRLGKTPLLGLPGNPVSTLVCALLFLRPAIAAMLGTTQTANSMTARLSTALKPNDGRQDYLRARMEVRDGERWVEPFSVQDSSMLSALAAADVLIVRRPHAPLAQIGERVSVLSLD